MGASSGSEHPYVGHACDTGSFWVQYHGSNVYGALTAAGQNFISRSEAHKFDPDMPCEMTNQQKKDWEAAHQKTNKAAFETDGAGRGVYTTQDFAKASHYAAPLLMNGQLVKFVVLCAIPGDLSDRGVAVNFKTKCATNLWQGEEKLDHWTRIPKHIVAEDAAEGWPEHGPTQKQ